MNDYTFIDQEGQTFHGEEAQKLLKKTNDSKFMTSSGIIKVDGERWKIAQEYERKSWMEHNLETVEDRNQAHADNFYGYKVLQSRNFNRVLEVGCGPFTNLKLILPILGTVEEVHLLDPLLTEYIKHPHCSYKDWMLAGHKVFIYLCSIEEMPISKKFDLIVMINVLEHVKDAEIAFDKVYDLLEDGGTLVFADVCFLYEYLEESVINNYDAGHPIRLSIDYMMKQLGRYNKQHYCRYGGMYNQPHRYDIYFIGRKI